MERKRLIISMMIQPHLLKFARIAVKMFRRIGILARIVERKYKREHTICFHHLSSNWLCIPIQRIRKQVVGCDFNCLLAGYVRIELFSLNTRFTSFVMVSRFGRFDLHVYLRLDRSNDKTKTLLHIGDHQSTPWVDSGIAKA